MPAPLRQASDRVRTLGASAAEAVRDVHVRLGRWALPVWASPGVLAFLMILALFWAPGGIRSAAEMPVTTTIFDARDLPVFTVFEERRDVVPLDRISPHLIQAVLAVEDERFADHRGLDYRRIVGAAMANLRALRVAQGGSTITQQLARQAFLSNERTLWRKAREAILALRLEASFSKDEILEMYLNRIYLGRGFYGVETAARGYFGKPAADLTVGESALIAGLIQAPSAYAPPDHLDRAVARRRVVLARMVEAGFLAEDEAATVADSAVRLRSGLGESRDFGDYFRSHVVDLLAERFGPQAVRGGGLRVYSTIDPDAQQAAERALQSGLARVERLPGFAGPRRGADASIVDGEPAYLQGALIALDPRSGQVRALVGGREFGESQFNRALDAHRQAGSAFKPFVYAAALEAGYTPATFITNLDEPVRTAAGDWVPDDGHVEAAGLTVREALRRSSNRAAVRMLEEVGITQAVDYAARLGLDAPPPVPSLVLGSGEVTLADMTTAYAAFINGGLVREPVFIRRVEDRDGNVLWEDDTTPQRAISAETAFLMADMLADVVNRGTGSRARQEGFRLAAGGKTGTTNDFKDGWFVGFTPTLAAGVWVGFDRPRTIAPNAYATNLAVPIWAGFMREATGNRRSEWIARPDGVTVGAVCLISGGRPTSGCASVLAVDERGRLRRESAVGYEYFREGTEPDFWCPLHGGPSGWDRYGLRIYRRGGDGEELRPLNLFPGAIRRLLDPDDPPRDPRRRNRRGGG
jgi:1A family penicillin-binding protein